MRPRSSLALAALAVVPLVATVHGCGADDAAPETAARPSPEWRVALEELDTVLLGIWGSSSSDVFFVGGRFGAGAGTGRILHWDGAGYRRMAAADAPSLWWTHGFAPDDVWAVGEGGTILHFDGKAWTAVDGGHDYTLWGVWGASASDVWAVGGSVTSATHAVVRHWDGQAWSAVSTGVAPAANYFKVWGTSASDVWIVGEAGTAIRWNGTAWTAFDSSTHERLTTVSGSATDEVYAVGGVASGVVVRFDGKAFSRESLDAAWPGVNGIWAEPGGSTFLAGYSGLLAERAAGSWSALPSLTRQGFHVIWGDGKGTVVAAGGNLLGASPGGEHGIIVARGEIGPGVLYDLPDAAAGDGAADLDAPDASDSSDASDDPDTSADSAGDAADAEGDLDGASEASDSSAAPDAFDAAEDGADVETADGADDGGADDASEAAAPLGPGADCSSNYGGCAAGLSCWYVVDSGATICTAGCSQPSDCAVDYGAGACCLIAGPQSLTPVCRPKGMAGCL